MTVATTLSLQEMLATGVSLLRCSVSYTLDVMKQMASLNPILDMSVSTHFHNVYDLLDPAKDNNLASSLEKLVSYSIITLLAYLHRSTEHKFVVMTSLMFNYYRLREKV